MPYGALFILPKNLVEGYKIVKKENRENLVPIGS
jgi:hypothetical protein